MRDSDEVKGAHPPPPEGQTPPRQGISPELQAEVDRLQAGSDVDGRLRGNQGHASNVENTPDDDLKREFASFRGGFTAPPTNPSETEGALSGATPSKDARRYSEQLRDGDSPLPDTTPRKPPTPRPRPNAKQRASTASTPLESSQVEEEEEDESDTASSQLSVVREAARAETIADSDALDRQALTNAVADLLTTRMDKHPLAMALFGAWGSGKSSFIDFVKKELSKRETTSFRFAEFNAWRNERVDNIGAALAQAVVESLVSERSLTQQVALAFRLAKRRKARLRQALEKDAKGAKLWLRAKWDWFTFALMYFAAPLAIVGLAVLLLFQTQVPRLLAGIVGTATAGLVAMFSVKIALSKELLDWFKTLAKDQKFSFSILPDYSSKLGSFHEMGRTLEDLCALTLSEHKDGRADFLLLVIDDLDRCSPDTIKQVFDAVRLVANIPQIVVLVALDERIAYSAVAKHYAEYGFSDREAAQVARDYMSKVFNVFVSLPGVQKADIDKYVRTRLFDVPGGSTGPGEVPPPPPPPPPPSPPSAETSSKLEAQTFSELVNTFDISNPRELWRLRQTWSLLKGFALPKHATDGEVRTWMRHMFFREMYLRGPAEKRREGKVVLDKLANGTADSADVLWNPVLTSTARELGPGFAARDARVMAVLLPAAPAEIKAAARPS